MLTVYEPKLEELWFRRLMLEDEETMAYNHAWGGTIPFPEEDWAPWYETWLGDPDSGRYYRYLRDGDGRFVGEIAFHFDEELGGHTANVIIYAKYRRKGFGNEGLSLLCKAAGANGLSALYDDIAIDNPGIAMFLKAGFTEEYRTDEIIMLKKELKRKITNSEET